MQRPWRCVAQGDDGVLGIDDGHSAGSTGFNHFNTILHRPQNALGNLFSCDPGRFKHRHGNPLRTPARLGARGIRPVHILADLGPLIEAVCVVAIPCAPVIAFLSLGFLAEFQGGRLLR